MIVMEWLRRIDERLVKFVQEKFVTELIYGSSTLTCGDLGQEQDTYISGLNRGGAVQIVNPKSAEPPVTWPEQFLTGDDYQAPFQFGGNYEDLPHAGDVSFASKGRGQFSQPFRPRGGKFSSQGFTPCFQQPRHHPHPSSALGEALHPTVGTVLQDSLGLCVNTATFRFRREELHS